MKGTVNHKQHDILMNLLNIKTKTKEYYKHLDRKKSHKEAYTYTLTKKEKGKDIYIYILKKGKKKEEKNHQINKQIYL